MNRKNILIAILALFLMVGTTCFWGCSQGTKKDETIHSADTNQTALNTETEQNSEIVATNSETTTDVQETVESSEATETSRVTGAPETTEAPENPSTADKPTPPEVPNIPSESDTPSIPDTSVVPDTPGTTPEPNSELTYEEYNALSAEEQYAYFLSFDSIEEYFAWYNQAKQEYEDEQDRTEIGSGGSVDIGGIWGN